MVNKIRSILKRFIIKIRFPNKAISIDPSSIIYPKSRIRIISGGSIIIGKNCKIHDYSMILSYKGNIEIGDNCSVNPYTILYGHGGLKIGNGVRIAAHCVIIPSNHKFERLDVPIYQQGEISKGIIIEDDVWIGAHCSILDGVRIGKGCVIGAGSVVNKSLPDFSVAVGVPARVISKRGE